MPLSRNANSRENLCGKVGRYGEEGRKVSCRFFNFPARQCTRVSGASFPLPPSTQIHLAHEKPLTLILSSLEHTRGLLSASHVSDLGSGTCNGSRGFGVSIGSGSGTSMEGQREFFFGDWRMTCTLLVVAAFALYHYLMSPFDYWKKRGFPELAIRPVPIFGHTLKMMIGQQYFADAFSELHRAAGEKKYVGIYVGNQPCLLVKDLDIMRQIFIKESNTFMDRAFEIDEDVDPLNAKGLSNLKGQRWKEMRARLSPTFTSGRMRAMLPLMQACADDLVQCFSKQVEEDGGEATVEIKEVFMCFSTDVIATCAFGVQCDALNNPETSKFRQMGKLTFQLTLKRTIVIALLLFSPRLLKWLGLKFSDDESSNFFREFVRRMVEQRERAIEQEENEGGENASQYRDFIYNLVSLKKRGLKHGVRKDEEDDDELEALGSSKSGEHSAEEPSWTNVSLDDLTAQAMQFFSAGFETTATLLSFALFELSSGEGVGIQRRVAEEVERVVKEEGGKITYEGLKKMHLLERVLCETLRLYPPVGLLNRLALQVYHLPGTNLTIEKGAQVTVALPAMHRDESIFPNPNRFDPDRFLPENKQKIDQIAFLPFGAGPRSCIGQRFAQTQARLGLATLLLRFEFQLCREKTKLPLTFKKRAMILGTDQGIWLNIKLRNQTSSTETEP
ncbi:cytochrome P450 6k1-like [Ischnura elegans]|uniref:cytochrome P450 6k1-like n=1 Tax=Ischnura elegans TaxID=197161 RepID=UPI001ED8B4AC|nr:cytochrome P450 6k1-like [Ischnura elegans]